MKRTLACLLAAILCASMAACGRNPVTPSSTESAGSALSSSDVSGDSAATGGTETADTTQNTESNSPAQTTTAGKTPTKATSSKPTSKPVVSVSLPSYNIQGQTVELLTHDSPETDASKELIARFKEAYGATLKMTNCDWASMQTVLNSRVMANNPPDVTVVRNADYYTYQLSGILQDISGKIDYSTPLWKDVKDINDSMKVSDKQYYAAINRWVGWYIWYNKSIMLDNGIMDTPDKLYDQGKWTVSAMRSLAKELTVRDGEKITQYGLGSDYGTLANCLEVARGATQVKRSGNTFSSNINDPALADAFNMLYDLYAADKCMTPIDQHNNMFAKGRCAMLVEGSWLPQQRSIKALKDKGSIGMVPFPKWEGQAEHQSGEVTCTGIPRGVKNTDKGMAFINFQRYIAIDTAQLKKSRETQKTKYSMTDKELDYQEAAADKAVVGSWLGIPNSPSYLMAMMVAYGNSWSLTVEKYGPDLKKSIDELNAMVKKG